MVEGVSLSSFLCAWSKPVQDRSYIWTLVYTDTTYTQVVVISQRWSVGLSHHSHSHHITSHHITRTRLPGDNAVVDVVGCQVDLQLENGSLFERRNHGPGRNHLKSISSLNQLLHYLLVNQQNNVIYSNVIHFSWSPLSFHGIFKYQMAWVCLFKSSKFETEISNCLFIGLDNMSSFYVAWKPRNYYFIYTLNISTIILEKTKFRNYKWWQTQAWNKLCS